MRKKCSAGIPEPSMFVFFFLCFPHIPSMCVKGTRCFHRNHYSSETVFDSRVKLASTGGTLRNTAMLVHTHGNNDHKSVGYSCETICKRLSTVVKACAAMEQCATGSREIVTREKIQTLVTAHTRTSTKVHSEREHWALHFSFTLP